MMKRALVAVVMMWSLGAIGGGGDGGGPDSLRASGASASLAGTVRGSGPSSQHWLVGSRSDPTLAEAEGPPLQRPPLHSAVRATLHAQQPEQTPQPQQQEEFVPIDELPPQDQLPAAPLLVTAYAVVVLALFAYVVSVARRLGAVQRDLDRLQSDLKRTGRT